MRIVIDLQGAQTESRFRGIGRYSISLAKAIVRNRGKNEIILALSGLFPDTIMPIRHEFDSLLPQENIRVWYAQGPIQDCVEVNNTRRKVAEILCQSFIKNLQPDILYISSWFEDYAASSFNENHQFPVVMTLYDLIPLKNPEQYLTPYPSFHKFYMKKLDTFKHAGGWLAISDFSRNEGIDALRLQNNKVINISTACDDVFRKIENSNDINLTKLGISKEFILYTGGADERKNLDNLIKAYSMLPVSVKEKYQLVIVGKMPLTKVIHFKHCATEAGLSKDDCIFTNYVPESNLITLYNKCKLYVFPSLYEGFGLPVLEAINCGTAVIASNCTSIPEVLGCEEAMFNPLDTISISKKMLQALTDEQFRNYILKEESKQKNKFSWDISAKKALDFFAQLSSSQEYRKGLSETTSLNEGKIINDIAKVGGVTTLEEGEIRNTSIFISQNKQIKRNKQLFIDISELAQRDSKTGVQRVTRSILNEVINDNQIKYNSLPVYATLEELGYKCASIFMQKFTNNKIIKHPKQQDEFADFCNGDIFLGLDLQSVVVAHQVDYYRYINNIGVKLYFVVYDLLPILLPNDFPSDWNITTTHTEWLKTITNFDGAICISKSVADELKTWMQENVPERLKYFDIKWFHLGADIDNSVPSLGMPDDSASVLAKLSSKPTFLMVGTIEPRKRQDQALDAFEELWSAGIDANLAIVGKKGWMTDELCKRMKSHAEAGKRLFWLEGISDEYLEKVYAASTCLIAASEGEGFGLPLIEAAQKKLPIIARDIPVFREVAGQYAFYFSGKSGHDLAEAAKHWLVLYKEGKHPKSDNMPWLTWKESTKQLLHAIGIDEEEGEQNG